MQNILDIMRREAAAQAAQRQTQAVLVVTSYNPEKHAVKGTLQPYGVESGWIPVATIGIGSGCGVVVGPSIGDQFAVEFQGGDPNSPVAVGRLFSSSDTPPKAESGEVIIKSQFGHEFRLTKDGKLTITAQGDTKLDVTGKLDISASGDTTIAVTGGATISASGALNITGSPINLN